MQEINQLQILIKSWETVKKGFGENIKNMENMDYSNPENLKITTVYLSKMIQGVYDSLATLGQCIVELNNK